MATPNHENKARSRSSSENGPQLGRKLRTNRQALKTDLTDIRRLGYAVSYGERQADAFSVASPILQAGDVVFGAISVCGPAQRFNEELGIEYGELLRVGAERISWELGYQGNWFSVDS